ncbi:hypothetical protein BC332_21649 [Capsicum chinense]|nr:hypothetical protein BC332_21649 [Capsicum chinense]
MEGKTIPLSFLFTFSIIFLSLFALSVTSSSLQYQKLVLHSLPETQLQSLNWDALDLSAQLLSADGSEPDPDTTLSGSDPDPNNVLSVQLHHVDLASPASFNATPHALFKLRLKRDAVRAKAISILAAANVTVGRRAGRGHAGGRDFSSSVISGLAQGSGEYFTRIGIGTPSKYAYMVLDTGSDVVWIQCSPCKKCYTQTDPVFDPTKSSSFVGVSCGSPLCRQLDTVGCSRKKCLYQVSYGDGSFTVGDFSTETLTFRGTRVNNIALGCGHDNEGLFVGAAGLLGLGRGRLSFPTQAGRRFGRKFSYCLVDRSASARPSYLVFGESAVSRTAVFTPLVTNPKLDTFYYVELAGISVGGTRVPSIRPSLFKLNAAGDGGVIVDSGTSVTRLTRPAYIALRDAFRVGARDLKRAPDFSLFDTCFDLSGKTEVKVPTVALHFRGADVSLPASNYLIPVDSDGTFCFAFAGTMSGLSIIGNIQQQGFRVVFDLAGSRLGFAPRGCA